MNKQAIIKLFLKFCKGRQEIKLCCKMTLVHEDLTKEA